MINLSKHIEALLLRHDCVIVPGLGGFVAHYVPAHYVPEEQLFLPPHRAVGFNAQLVTGDGLLAQSCMQAADSSYPEALQLIADAVEQLKAVLQAEGHYVLEGIGVLRLNLNGGYDFTPMEAGVLSPALYGLGSVTMALNKALDEKETGSEDVGRSTAELVKKSHSLLLRGWVNYVAAAAVALVFYLLWATPIANGDNGAPQITPQVATMLPTGHAVAFSCCAAGNSVADAPLTATQWLSHAAPQEGEETATVPESAEQAPAVDNDAKPYTIVLVSCVPLSGAEQMVAELHQHGMDAAEVLVGKKIIRVTYGHYGSENEARGVLRTLRDDSRFDDAWIMKQ